MSPENSKTPWLNTSEAAQLMKFHAETVRRAVRTYQRTSGRSGLRALQRTGQGRIRIHVDDLLRWADGLPPATGTRRYRAGGN